MILGLVSATKAPRREEGIRRLPWATPPGASRDGTSGRLPTDMASSYDRVRSVANGGGREFPADGTLSSWRSRTRVPTSDTRKG